MTPSLRDGFIFERDIQVPMRDGQHLAANVFRPRDEKPAPLVMSVTPYGKDKLPDRIGMFFMRLGGVRFGDLRASHDTGFEAPDPIYWVRNGYSVLLADVRGMHKSQGQASVLSARDGDDYYDLIEWAADQPWCDGGVALAGVSYLAMSQWRVAALKPDHLKAIIPWEGASDLYREFAFQGGIPETGFIPIWWRNRMVRGHDKDSPLAEDFLTEIARHPLDDQYWMEKRPILESIEAPALVCASWSDQGLHTRGSFEGFTRIASRQKWLYTHGRKKWETYYSDEAVATQRRFLDHFLKGIQNGWLETPRVRLEVRKSGYQRDVRYESDWPIGGTRFVPLYLDPGTDALQVSPVRDQAHAAYESATGRATFSIRFADEVEITGESKLRLWVGTSEGDDLDLFVLLRKFDPAGKEVFFSGYNGWDRDAVAKGWLRASHRALDAARSRPSRPFHRHDRIERLAPGDIVPVEIEILPSSTSFEPLARLELSVQGKDPAKYPAFKHTNLVNRGVHTIYCGGRFDSHVLLPLTRGAITEPSPR